MRLQGGGVGGGGFKWQSKSASAGHSVQSCLNRCEGDGHATAGGAGVGLGVMRGATRERYEGVCLTERCAPSAPPRSLFCMPQGRPWRAAPPTGCGQPRRAPVAHALALVLVGPHNHWFGGGEREKRRGRQAGGAGSAVGASAAGAGGSSGETPPRLATAARSAPIALPSHHAPTHPSPAAPAGSWGPPPAARRPLQGPGVVGHRGCSRRGTPSRSRQGGEQLKLQAWG